MGDPNAFQQMQDEMSRFEAEISGGDIALVPMAAIPQMRPIIGVRTFGAVQQRLEGGLVPPPPPPPALLAGFEHPGMAPRMFPALPPPPPPPSMMVPHQVQRSTYHQPMQYMRATMPGPQLIPPPPPKPQPVILSAAPKLYKQPKKDDAKDAKPSEPKKKKKEQKEPQQPPPPAAPKPEPLPAPSLPPSPAPRAPSPSPSPAPTPAPPAPQLYTDPPAATNTNNKPKKEKKNRKVVRMAGGQTWEDVTLLDWPDDDFRMFCGDLGNDVTDELLTRTFGKYTSFQRAKVIRDKRTNKSKGFGFVSFKEPSDFIKAMKEMDGRYVGSRPIKLRKSNWKNRSMDVVKKKDKEKAALLSLLMSGGKC